jgi:hypothetical protein
MNHFVKKSLPVGRQGAKLMVDAQKTGVKVFEI